MLSREDNERITRVGRGSPMGSTMRRYWIPALLVGGGCFLARWLRPVSA